MKCCHATYDFGLFPHPIPAACILPHTLLFCMHPDEIRAEMKHLKMDKTVLSEVDKRFKDNMVSYYSKMAW